MRALKAVAIVLILVAGVTGAAYAQDDGATITFTNTETLMYSGTGEMRAETPMECPITVGNFRIVKIQMPSEFNRDNVGLVIPFRGALSERMVDLDPRWGGAGAVSLVCEVIDPDEPIGFRMRAHAKVRMFHSPGAWLALNLGRGPKDDHPIPADTQNKRFTGELHRWYVLSDMNAIYHLEEDEPAPEQDRFTIMLDTGERGSWWVKSLELKSWPTRLGE